MFNAGWKIGMATGCAVFLLTAYRSLLFSMDVWKVIWRRIPNLSMLLWMMCNLYLAFFAWSTQFVDVSISTVLFELWPIVLIALTGWLFRQEARYRRVTVRTLILYVFAFLGVGCVIASQTGGLGNFMGSSPLYLLTGVVLVLAAALLTSLAAFGFRWGADLGTELAHSNGQFGRGPLELFGVIAGLLICSSVAIPVTASVGFARDEPVTLQAVALGVVGGLLTTVLGDVVWRKANLITHDLSINALAYLTPVFALGWLFAFGLVGDVNLGYLFIGAAAVVIANVGIYFEMEDPRGRLAESSGELDVSGFVDMGESDTVEFKSSLRQNPHTNERDRRIELAVLKTLAAFLNTDGGTLVVGVSDDHAPVGIDVDEFQNEDRMGLHLRNIVNSRMGSVAMSHIHSSFDDFQGVRVMVVRCEPSNQPVYVEEGNNSEKFYIRTGPSTTELSISESNRYIRDRF